MKTFASSEVHEVEAFGPVSTVMPYKNLEEAIELSKKGNGSLCSSIVTADNKIATTYVIGAAPYHGRILILNAECAKESTGHGSPLPLLVHGGPAVPAVVKKWVAFVALNIICSGSLYRDRQLLSPQSLIFTSKTQKETQALFILLKIF